MSQRELEAVIGRAILDQEFRMALFADRAVALAGYELTEAEAAALRSVDAESLDGCASMFGGRVQHILNPGS
jgi:hypothetical protein